MRSRHERGVIRLPFVILLCVLFCRGGTGRCAEKPIKIGGFFALSGPAESVGAPAKLVARMVEDKINKEGGVNNRPLELFVGDTESDPTRALMEAKRLVETGRVVAVIGPTRAESAIAVRPYFEETAHVPIMMMAGGDRVSGGGESGSVRWVFKMPQRTSVVVRRIYDYLRSRKQTRIALLTSTDRFGREGLSSLERLAPECGIEVVARESFDATDPDVTPQLVKVRDSKAEALVCWTIGPAGARVAKSAKQLSMAVPLIQCPEQANPKYIELAGDAADGTIMPSTKIMVVDQLPDNDPQKAVIEDFIGLYTNANHFDRQYPITAHSGYVWDALFLLTDAMRQAGTDPELLRSTIEKTRGFVGVGGIYNLSPEDHNGLGTDSMVMIRVEKGKWVLVH